MPSLNRVVLVGNLTRDPELRQTPTGTSVCTLGLAVNTRMKRDGEWTEKPNFFDVVVWGAQAENCATYLQKGRPVAVDGRLDYRAWETAEGAKRSKIEIIAETVQFLGGGRGESAGAADPQATPPPQGSDDEDDIPF